MYGKSLDVTRHFQKKILAGQDSFWEAKPTAPFYKLTLVFENLKTLHCFVNYDLSVKHKTQIYSVIHYFFLTDAT